MEKSNWKYLLIHYELALMPKGAVWTRKCSYIWNRAVRFLQCRPNLNLYEKHQFSISNLNMLSVGWVLSFDWLPWDLSACLLILYQQISIRVLMYLLGNHINSIHIYISHLRYIYVVWSISQFLSVLFYLQFVVAHWHFHMSTLHKQLAASLEGSI